MTTPLPNLSEGKLGRLDFRHINRVFRAVEQFERMLPMIRALVGADDSQAFDWMPVRIRDNQALSGATNRYQYSWIEVEWNPAASPADEWDDKSGGLSSTVSANNFANPMYNLAEFQSHGVGVPVRDDEIVPMFYWYDKEGDLVRFFHRPVKTIYTGIVSARSATTNATYTANAVEDAGIAVSTATPINRPISTSAVTWNAAAVNDACILLVNADQSIDLVILTETVGTSACA